MVVGVVVVLATIGSQTPDAGPTAANPSPTPTSSATQLPTSSGPGATFATPTEAPSLAPEPTASVAFEPIRLTGKGTKVVRFKIPDGDPAIAVIVGKSTSNFVI